MPQLDLLNEECCDHLDDRQSQLHDLRNRLNTIMTSAMVLDRVGAVCPEHQKYLAWILEKTHEAGELVELISRDCIVTEK